jgi:hypothetical protein
LLVGYFQAGDEPSCSFRIGLRHEPAKPHGELILALEGGYFPRIRVVDELKDALRFRRMLGRERLGDREVATSAPGAAVIADERQHAIELDPGRGRQEIGVIPLTRRERVADLQPFKDQGARLVDLAQVEPASGDSRQLREPALRVDPLPGTRGRACLSAGVLDELELPLSFSGGDDLG